MLIRGPGPEDAAGLLVMVEGLTRHHGDVPRLTLDSLQRDLFGALPWFQVLVAEDEGALVGYAALLPLARLGYGARGMDLHHLFVAEGHRGRGVGTAVVAACEALARGLACSYLIIGTHPDNRAAQVWYQGLGYAPIPNTAMRLTKALD